MSDDFKKILEEATKLLDEEATESEKCPRHLNGVHVPDWTTITSPDGAPDVIDVECAYCGRSGSFPVPPESEVNW